MDTITNANGALRQPAHPPRESFFVNARRYATPLSAFVVLELGYFAFATICLVSPVVLPNSAQNHETATRSGFSVLFVAWQTLAILPILTMFTPSVMSDWRPTHRRASSAPNAFSGTPSFILSITATVAALLLFNLAPAAITVSTASISSSQGIFVGNFTINGTDSLGEDSDSSPSLYATYHAASIVQLEQISLGAYGANMVYNNCAVGWPQASVIGDETLLSYPSDSACWNHQCRWEAPTVLSVPLSGAFNLLLSSWNVSSMPNVTWSPFLPVTPPIDTLSAIFAMSTDNITSTNGTSAFLFLGSNSSLYQQEQGSGGIDLTNLPSLYNTTGFPLQQPGVSGVDSSYSPRLASMLLCDPQTTISSNIVTLDSLGNMVITGDPATSIGNLKQTTADVITFKGLTAAVALMDQPSVSSPQILASTVAEALFMSGSITDWTPPKAQVPPASLQSINRNMDRFMTSAAKAYSNGFVLPGVTSLVGVDATMQSQTLALTGAKAMLIAAWCLFGIMLAAVVVVQRYGRTTTNLTAQNLRMASLAAGGDDEQANRRDSTVVDADSINHDNKNF